MSDQSAGQTFLFADLAGFTALTEAHGDDQAVDLLDDFLGAVRALLSEYKAEEVKCIGDAVMLRCPDAASAIGLGVRVVYEIGGRHGFPIIRAGMHSGKATERRGDWFGATVNLAARVAAAATGGEVLLTEATAKAAGSRPDVAVSERGKAQLRNIADPVVLFRAAPATERSPDQLPIDPVCRMAVDPDSAAGSLTYDGRKYVFCSLKCASEFASRPSNYALATDD
jgi:adenylate cyclase